jgi:leucyl aminopeptidase (aminopeptidase T)
MLEGTISDAEIARAARQIVRSALRVVPGERMVVLGDERSARLATALHDAAVEAEAHVTSVWLEGLGRRPLSALDDKTVKKLERAAVSAFVASAPHQEIRMRQHLLHLVTTLGLRHAHMPGISDVVFARGMQADHVEIGRIGEQLLARLAGAPVVRTTSPFGTDLEARFGASSHWFAQVGELAPGRWGNLPSGALYATPETVNGVFVASASIGEFFGQREGLLTEKPVRFDIVDGRVKRVETFSRELDKDIRDTLSFGLNSDRVGLVCVGVNVGMSEPTGEAIADQNLPGLHLAIGDPAARVTGATWSARTSFAACQARSTVMLGDEVIVHEGVVLRS